MNAVTWLTQEAHDALAAELQERTGPRRKEITGKIEVAREEGDLKENGGYHAAREEQGQNEARIRTIESILRTAQIGAPESADDEVAHGKVITVRFVALDMEQEFLLASREEAAHASIDVYSPASPMGQALIGKKVGDSAEYQTPTGATMSVEVLDVKPYGG